KQIGRFCHTKDGTALFFRHADHRLYEISDRCETPFGQLITHLADMSVAGAIMRRALDRLRAHVSQDSDEVEVHGMAYSSPDARVIAINDLGGGMWYRERGGTWEWKPNGQAGILFWTPSELVTPWKPEFGESPELDESYLTGLVESPHFANDVL